MTVFRQSIVFRQSMLRKTYRSIWARRAVALVMMAIGMTLMPALTSAQQQRIIQGKVLGASDEPVSGAVVYLKDVKTLGVKSFISTTDGSYRFGQLADAVDYEVRAEQGGRKSPVKTISSFDQKKEYNINLKLGK